MTGTGNVLPIPGYDYYDLPIAKARMILGRTQKMKA
jgi:hypothetical protein